MSSLSPAQLEAKREEVAQHVALEASQQGLSDLEATQLLQETLMYNGLAQADPAPSSPSSGGEPVPGLPVPGTLEHTVTLALFNAQQYIKQVLSPPSQPPIENKLGVAASENGEAGIVSSVSSLPSSLTSAAVQVLKFVSPDSEEKTEPEMGPLRPGQSYSEVVTGVDPTYAALGVLTTGALASVAYSYVASDPDIASSATDLALGAVDAIARNDIVQNIANNDIVEKIKNNDIVRKATDAISNNKLIRKASSAIASIKKKITGDGNGDFDPQQYYSLDNNYGDYGAGLYQTDFDYYQELAYTDRYPYQESDSRDSQYPHYSDDDGWHMQDAWSDQSIEWFEPESSTVSESVPYVPYSQDNNPWHLLNSGQSTDHLYRAFTD